ncbi:MAG: cytochrome c peroxidase [Candidatus Kapaibacteriales bacterium]
MWTSFRKIHLIIFGLIVIALVFIASKDGSPESIVTSIHNDNLLGLVNATKELNISAQDYLDSKISIEELIEVFEETREELKRSQMIGEYLDPQSYYWYLNGPPLIRLDRKDNIIDPLEPEGLQAIDEEINADEVNKERVLYLSERLANSTLDFVKYQSRIKLNKRNVFEAARFELIRILSLGVTGFDTPASSENAIQENLIAFEALERNIKPFYSLIEKRDEKLVNEAVERFTAGKKILTDYVDDFDGFPRHKFTREVIETLFSVITRSQKILNVESANEISKRVKYSTDYGAENIFTEKLHNPFYYTQITEKTFSNDLANLGHTLFFDPALSGNNDRACASCHKPELGYTDGSKKSIAKDFDGTVLRNAPTLLNAVLSDRFFYDLRALDVESQVEHVITNPQEFHTDYLAIVEKIKTNPDYKRWFDELFPDMYGEKINPYTIGGALAAFESTLVSFNSPWDRYARGEDVDISPEVLAGYDLFMGKAACGTCHFAPTFSGLVPPLFHESESEVLGVPVSYEASQLDVVLDNDIGRFGGVLKDRAEHYKSSFKTMTVRNIELTAPYMHNGGMATLEDVMDFYNKGGGAGLGLDVPHQTLAADKLGLTTDEINKIIIFMKALTDTSKVRYAPEKLPMFKDTKLNNRKIGGEY